MDNGSDFFRHALASAAITLGMLSFGVVAVSVAHAGVPLPVVAETTGMPSLAAVVKRIAPSVVNIEGRGRVAAAPGTKGRQAGKGIGPALAAREEIRTFGSGVVFDARRGLVVTNSHVIDRADEITVKLTDGRTLPARRVGADPETDVAVIQVLADGLTELSFGNSDRLEVGDFVFAIGNPQTIGQTVTAGIVSGLHRANVGLGPYEDFIQTDAAMYPGNSGGALVDLRGDLVGINTAFIAVGKNNPGMGLAIPINMARSLVDQMLEFGDIRRGALGFTYDDLRSARSRDLAGAIVRAVDPQSAAERAGLKPGDLVTNSMGHRYATPPTCATNPSNSFLNIGRFALKAEIFRASLCSINFQYPKFGSGAVQRAVAAPQRPVRMRTRRPGAEGAKLRAAILPVIACGRSLRG
jgi:S1-C subfamily serine protease